MKETKVLMPVKEGWGDTKVIPVLEPEKPSLPEFETKEQRENREAGRGKK